MSATVRIPAETPAWREAYDAAREIAELFGRRAYVRAREMHGGAR